MLALASGSRTTGLRWRVPHSSSPSPAIWSCAHPDSIPCSTPAYFAEPEWLAADKVRRRTRGSTLAVNARARLDPWDQDSSRGFLNPAGLTGSASRAALSGQTAFYPSAWQGREMLSYDAAVLWPGLFNLTTRALLRVRSNRAGTSSSIATGVRYRVLPDRLAAGRAPLVKVPYDPESFLYDWGPQVAPRASVVESVTVVADPMHQVTALFTAGWNSRDTAVTDREVSRGRRGRPRQSAPSARIVVDQANRVVVEAGAGAAGGYLVLLDSFSDDWRVTVDGAPRHGGAGQRALSRRPPGVRAAHGGVHITARAGSCWGPPCRRWRS